MGCRTKKGTHLWRAKCRFNMRKTNCLRGKPKKKFFFLMLFLTYLSINNYSKAPETCKLVRETSKYLARIEINC